MSGYALIRAKAKQAVTSPGCFLLASRERLSSSEGTKKALGYLQSE